MPFDIELALPPEKGFTDEKIEQALAEKLAQKGKELHEWQLLKRSIDARKKPIIRLKCRVYGSGEELIPLSERIDYTDVSDKHQVAVIGAGPAGLFAALKLIELGIKPVVFERGKDVRERRRDLAAINKEHLVNPESNYCFGEGGAGTYSDGKLYTRSTKRGNVRRILDVLIEHGADERIAVEAHPHIGTNKLPGIITHMRETIESHGGEIHFNSKLTDLKYNEGCLESIQINAEQELPFHELILATGHSARDIFELLNDKGLSIEFKPYAMGVRVEHPQKMIDKLQYNCATRDEFLPPASYSLVTQIEDKGVYSFCMCPGGIIAPCATDVEEVVTNGWSPSKRNNPWANSGIVTQVHEEDVAEFESEGALKGLRFQQRVERDCWEAGGKTQAVPAQRLKDFVDGVQSKTLPDCSYQPGLVSVRLDQILPEFISERLRNAFRDFGKKMKGYLTNDAVVVAPESRTSSPVRIPRDKDSLEHPDCKGLYPCGEGAGYAGGIVSAAIDGEKVAAKCAESIFKDS